jgi:hypothetical protein
MPRRFAGPDSNALRHSAGQIHRIAIVLVLYPQGRQTRVLMRVRVLATSVVVVTCQVDVRTGVVIGREGRACGMCVAKTCAGNDPPQDGPRSNDPTPKHAFAPISRV